MGKRFQKETWQNTIQSIKTLKINNWLTIINYFFNKFQYDIREASQEIRDSYKMYYKLKTSFLEDTLNDVLSDDGFDVLEMSQREGELDVSLTESVNGGPQLPLDISKLIGEQQQEEQLSSQENCNGFSNIQELPGGYALTNLANKSENHVIKEFEPVEVLPLNENAWGPKVAMKPEIKEKKEEPRRSLKPNFKEKLFQNASFSKRNPRKSLSRSTLDSSLRGSQTNLSDSLNTSNKEVLPDLETILLQKAKEQQAAATIAANPLLAVEKSKESIKTQVDEGWLERNAAQNGIKTKKVQKVEENNNISSPAVSRKSVYGLSNIDVSKLQTTIQPTETKTETTTLPETDNVMSMDIENCETEVAKSHFQEMPLEKPKKSPLKSSKSQDSDSVVDDSEEEKESQEYRHIVKRRRVIPSTSPKAVVNNSQSEKPDVQPELESKIPTNNDSEKDFSPDSEKDDEDYVEEKPKAKRKKAVAKRKTAAAKPKTSPKTKRTTTKSSPKEKSTKTTSPKEKKPRASTRGASKKKKAITSEELPEEEIEEQPLNPEDLKYSLALERGDITSVPRIKQTDLDKADNLAQQYINTIAPMPGTVPSSRPIPITDAEIKRDAARRKLEEKIATGKLNENFVTINIQKKTFVRGKKSVNYSKYKKKLWKHKKHIAALSGPNMDMGGCDGGTLKCFTCGQAGHFAQNCKVKGDSLLPLTAQLEEDPSPFPTLEEAERMASKSAVAVHSRNIAKMPQAANAAIYSQMEEDEFSGEENDEVSIENL